MFLAIELIFDNFAVFRWKTRKVTNSFSLSDTMGSAHCLEIILWIPVRIEDDNGIRGGQIDAKSSCSRGQQEAEISGTLSIEMV